MTVAITGGAGFLSSNIVDYFDDQGEGVVVTDLSDRSCDNLSQLIDHVEIRGGDFCGRGTTVDAIGIASEGPSPESAQSECTTVERVHVTE